MLSEVRIDKTPPLVTYTGNAGRYTMEQQIEIHCACSDALSGIATHNCQDITGPAYNFVTGTQQAQECTFSATATDRANNTTTASVTFTIAISNEGLQDLARQFCTDPAVLAGLLDKLNAAKAAAARGNATAMV